MKVELPFGEVKRCFRLVNELFGLKCFRDLLDTGIYPNMKEMTESAAVIWALRYRIKDFSLSDPGVVAICVGDGATPRTGAMLAFRSLWDVISVDPLLPKDVVFWDGVHGLACSSKKIEDVYIFGPYEKAVIVAVHSHAPLQIAVDKVIADHKIVVAIPCCVRQDLDVAPIKVYRDDGIWSPQNKVKIWRLYDETKQ